MIGIWSGVGMPAVFSRLPVRDGVVFIGIDDGWTTDPRAAALISRQHLPVSAFLIDDASRLHPKFFRALQQAGVTIQDHTLTHPVLPRLSADAQRLQICVAADRLGATYGRRPTLLRPPYGLYNQASLQAAASCGIDAVILWDVTVNHGVIRTQGGPVRAGDIVLMHFTPNLYQDLNVLLGLLSRRHLRVARLEDAIRPRSSAGVLGGHPGSGQALAPGRPAMQISDLPNLP